eukprot:1441155-Amphidinium_carterae.1
MQDISIDGSGKELTTSLKNRAREPYYISDSEEHGSCGRYLLLLFSSTVGWFFGSLVAYWPHDHAASVPNIVGLLQELRIKDVVHIGVLATLSFPF